LKFGDERSFCGLPVRLIGEFDFGCRRDVVFQFLFESFLASLVIFVTLAEPAGPGLESGEA